MVTKEYDIIIVGGGINSLTAAALLAKKNKSILLLESRDELGGMATLEEFSPGFKCNMVYDYIRWIDPRLLKKLNLYKYGLKFQKVSSLRIEGGGCGRGDQGGGGAEEGGCCRRGGREGGGAEEGRGCGRGDQEG